MLSNSVNWSRKPVEIVFDICEVVQSEENGWEKYRTQQKITLWQLQWFQFAVTLKYNTVSSRYNIYRMKKESYSLTSLLLTEMVGPDDEFHVL